MYARVGLLRSEYEDYINGEGMDLDGRTQAHAPGYQFSVGADVAFGEGYFAQVAIDGRDEFYFSDSHSEKSKPYTLLNASVGLSGPRLVCDGLGAQHLTDEDYFVRGFFFGNDPRDGYTDRSLHAAR